MPYATQLDMMQRFGQIELTQLTDRENTGSIDVDVLNQALGDADTEINGHLEGRYTLPLSRTPKILVTYACDIARYRLYDDRATEQVTKRYESAMKFLRMVAEGRLSLGLDENGEATPPVGGPAHASEDRVFTQTTLADFKGEC
jgi:phage gp36-like protein